MAVSSSTSIVRLSDYTHSAPSPADAARAAWLSAFLLGVVVGAAAQSLMMLAIVHAIVRWMS
jgi:hypothetical protein